MNQISSPPERPQLADLNAARWLSVGLLVAAGLVALFFARQLIAPLDGLLTSQACSAHGDELSRPVVEYERSNRFALQDRAEGWCLFGPIETAEGDAVASEDVGSIDTLQLTLDEIEPGGLYRVGKLMGIVLQFGAASFVVRALADPLLDLLVRRRN